MRILHTADWHLGKMFYGSYLTDDQAYVLTEQFLPLIRDEHIDAVVLAGDVYDRSLPPTEAVALFDEISTKITAEMGVPFFVISGNHDSAARLSFGSALLAKEGLHIAGTLDKLPSPITLYDQDGPVTFVSLPFAEPAAVRHYLQADDIRSHEQALVGLMQHQGGVPQGRSVCIAHAFVAGSTASDSERPLSIGGTDMVDSSIFSGYTYTALGHLHGPQQAGSPAVRYAGSLLKYSFGEARQKKGALVVDIDGSGTVQTVFQPFVPKHDVQVVEGFFDDIMRRDDEGCGDFLLFRLADEAPILDGMAKLRKKYPRAMALETPNRRTAGSEERSFDLHGTTERQLFESFAMAMQGDRPLTEAERTCMDELWKGLLEAEGGGLL
ncbi:exonuclease SbcCD subunit D [uncultured Megasphaera sp.]|uniref:exonuclease SbcCD subunit D n=1 Tax=uncultured Megasphaera sp. TaxID=165188 RepID=UPI00265B2CC9|nr:exonuclease SbcCD subunit D [uncultured Megasphaera sp.]